MKIFFSGIGGVGIGPLAEIAHNSGHKVIGSDQNNSLITKGLKELGIEHQVGNQDGSYLEQTHRLSNVDLLVYTSALPKDHPELLKAQLLGIKTVKRDELLNIILKQNNLNLIAIAGTHGKTGTTAMMVWVFKKLGIPISYSIGSTIKFGKSGAFDPNSQYFIYECDEFDRNFLNFHPYISVVTSLGYDHPDTYPTEQDYLESFRQFVRQSQKTIAWDNQPKSVYEGMSNITLLSSNNKPDPNIQLIGEHNRRNANLVLIALEEMGIKGNLINAINSFPGVDRRFEKLAKNLYSDYAHHPVEIAATLDSAHEISNKISIIYQPHQNIRQHNIKEQYSDQFLKAKKIYWLPTFLSREDKNLNIISPQELSHNVKNKSSIIFADLDKDLWAKIKEDLNDGYIVIGMGAGNIDAWLRSYANELPPS